MLYSCIHMTTVGVKGLTERSTVAIGSRALQRLLLSVDVSLGFVVLSFCLSECL